MSEAETSSRTPTVIESPEFVSWLNAVADLLIPASDGMPAASQVGVATTLLPRVLAARPDLEHLICRLFIADHGGDSAAASTRLDDLRDLDSAAFEAVCLAVAGGYYLDPGVRGLLEYAPIQRSVEPAEDIDLDALERVIERGPIYREV